MAKAKLFVITGPSGAGKTTIAEEILKKNKNITKVITCTTREPRRGERNGVDYKFVSRVEFEKFIKKDLLLEKALVYDNYYGSLRDDVEKIMESGKSVLFVVDVQGALTIKSKFRGAVSFFVRTPTILELRKRLEKRKKDSVSVIDQRMGLAREELELEGEFNHVIINDDLKKAVKLTQSIIDSVLK